MLVAGAENRCSDVEGGRVYKVRGFPVSRDANYRQLFDLAQLRRVLKTEKPDVIEIGSAYLDSWLGLLGNLGLNALTVGFYHADFPDSYFAPAVSGWPKTLSNPVVDFWRKYVRLCYSRFDLTCATSSYTEEKLRKYGVRNTVRIPLGVDLKRFSPAKRSGKVRRALNVNPDDMLLLYAGRFSSEKGLDTLLNSLPAIVKLPHFKIALIGAGPLRAKIYQQCARMNQITILPYEKNPDQLARLYASADLFLAPGPFETFGLAALEALASGVPVIAPAQGGAGELVTSSGAGVLFSPHDSSDLTRCVLELTSGGLARLGKRGRSFAEKHRSWNHTFTKMIHTYEEFHHAKRSGHLIAA